MPISRQRNWVPRLSRIGPHGKAPHYGVELERALEVIAGAKELLKRKDLAPTHRQQIQKMLSKAEETRDEAIRELENE